MAPLIAIPTQPLSQRRLDPYLQALRRAGGVEALMLPQSVPADDARAFARRFDGVMLLGGDDIDPVLYGADASEHIYGADAARDEAEIALTRAAIDERVPVLAICRGHQVLNVAFGGSLHQHITDRHDLVGHGIPARDDGAQIHDVDVTRETRLADALGATRVSCSSHHHQAVDRVGNGLRVVASADDGIIEGLEPSDPDAPWVVGVQWHPEETAASDATQQRLFDHFVSEARVRER